MRNPRVTRRTILATGVAAGVAAAAGPLLDSGPAAAERSREVPEVQSVERSREAPEVQSVARADIGGTAWVAGRSGNAVDLNGSTGYVTLPAGILAGATASTVAAWVRIDTLATWSRVFDFGSSTSVNMFLTPRSSGGTARFAITNSGAGGEQRINAPAALPTGAWTHVAVTLSGSVGVLYVNGAEVARNPALTLTPASLGSTTQNRIGRSQYADPYLDGAVDGLRLYSRALSASEISALASSGT